MPINIADRIAIINSFRRKMRNPRLINIAAILATDFQDWFFSGEKYWVKLKY